MGQLAAISVRAHGGLSGAGFRQAQGGSVRGSGVSSCRTHGIRMLSRSGSQVAVRKMLSRACRSIRPPSQVRDVPAARSLSPCPCSLIMASSARVSRLMGQIAPACFICCAWVAKSSLSILLRADSYRPPSLTAPAMPVSSRVTEVLVITEDPWGMRASTAARGVEVTGDPGAEPVLLQRDHRRRQRLLIGQRGETIRYLGRAHRGPPSQGYRCPRRPPPPLEADAVLQEHKAEGRRGVLASASGQSPQPVGGL